MTKKFNLNVLKREWEERKVKAVYQIGLFEKSRKMGWELEEYVRTMIYF